MTLPNLLFLVALNNVCPFAEILVPPSFDIIQISPIVKGIVGKWIATEIEEPEGRVRIQVMIVTFT